MPNIYYDADTNLELMHGKRIAASSATAVRAMLMPSTCTLGCNVVVGLPSSSKSRAKAEADGLRVMAPSDAAEQADVIMNLMPDQHHREVFERAIRPGLAPGKLFMTAHGFSLHYSQIVPPADIDVMPYRMLCNSVLCEGAEPGPGLAFGLYYYMSLHNIRYGIIDVVMEAPKSPGHILRRLFSEGVGVPALWAVHQDATGNAEALTLAYARAIGCTRAGVLHTTIAEETETDLFGEQAVLCSGITSLIRAGFEM